MNALADLGSVEDTNDKLLSYAESDSPQSFLLVCQDVFLVGLADETLRSQILQLCSVILLSGERLSENNPPTHRFQHTKHFTHVQKRGTCAYLQPCAS